LAAGDILKNENLIVEVFTAKDSEDLELGEIVYNDGNGILAATSAAKGPYFMAMEAHTYTTDSDHEIPCVVVGYCDVQAKPANALVEGRYVEMSTTAGEVTLFDYASGVFTDIVGIGMEAVATTGTDAYVLLGTYP